MLCPSGIGNIQHLAPTLQAALSKTSDFVLALAALFLWNKRWIVPAVIAVAAAAGLIVKVFS